MSQAHLGTFDLPVAGLTTKVGGHFKDVRDPSGSDRVALRDETPRDIDRHSAATEGRARVDEVTSTAPLAESQVVVMDQLGRGKTVVQLHQVEILGPDP